MKSLDILAWAWALGGARGLSKEARAWRLASSKPGEGAVLIGRRDAAHAAAIAERRRDALLHKLHDGHRQLDDEIASLDRSCVHAAERVRQLKKKKLTMKDSIAAAEGRLRVSRPAREPRLGAGGCGQVLAAFDAATGEAVAFKLSYGDAAFGDMLRCEFDVLRRLEHASRLAPFPRALDFHELRGAEVDALHIGGPAGKCFALVLERLGPSLDDVWWATTCGARGFCAPTLLALARQLVSALSLLGRLGVIHRDVQPANVLFADRSSKTAHDAVKLIDFGVCATLSAADAATFVGADGSLVAPDASLVDADASLVAADASFVGTPRFASANALAGGPAAFADDLESLALSLFYLSTGTMPWHCDLEDVSTAEALSKLARAKAALVSADLCHGDAADVIALLFQTARETQKGCVPDYAACIRAVEDALHRIKHAPGNADSKQMDWHRDGVYWDHDGVHLRAYTP
ncbi:kinase-like domain-containing protein [Pelagophyceae sp. CCMP2097]|nr:kinase-like domain-containing protein [Pelagophyceae sp. CCMP2097]